MASSNPLSKQSESPETVAIIIPTCNRRELLESCLRHLEYQTFGSFRVVVVNNGTQAQPSLCHQFYPVIQWIDIGRNEGTAAAFNRGIAACRDSAYVFLLNDDAEVEPACLEVLVKALEHNPGYSIAVPKLLQWSNPSRLDGAGDEIVLGGGAYRVGHGQLDEGQYDHVEEVLGACAAAALYRRSIFDEVGNFDEDYFAYGEDVDLSLRALLRGHHCLFVPGARVHHRGSATMGSLFHPKIMRLITRNRILTIAKDYPFPGFLFALPRILFFQTLWMAFAIKKHAFLASCAGLLGAVRLLTGTLRKRRQTMSRRTISNREWWRRVNESEKRIWGWHNSIRKETPSKLLGAYFAMFGPPGA